jgi:Icc-related predicted phosphoesterase
MLISATSDLDIQGIDSEIFWEAMKAAREPDIFLLAGDMYDFRSPEMYGLMLDFIKLKKWKCPIVAVFGNHEVDEDIDEIKKICKGKVTFLEDEIKEFRIGGQNVGIVGTRGSLDEPMIFWQSSNFLNIEKLLNSLNVDVKILLSHFSPTYKTLVGEDKRLFPGMGSKKLENVLVKTKTSLAIHGHAHYGTRLAFVDSVPVFNVNFDVNRKLVEIDTKKLPKPVK